MKLGSKVVSSPTQSAGISKKEGANRKKKEALARRGGERKKRRGSAEVGAYKEARKCGGRRGRGAEAMHVHLRSGAHAPDFLST